MAARLGTWREEMLEKREMGMAPERELWRKSKGGGVRRRERRGRKEMGLERRRRSSTIWEVMLQGTVMCWDYRSGYFHPKN